MRSVLVLLKKLEGLVTKLVSLLAELLREV
jgi:hypothetical protein